MADEGYIEAIKETLKAHQGEDWILQVYDLYGGDLISYMHFKEFKMEEKLAIFCENINSDEGRDYRVFNKEGLELDLARDAETAMRKVRKNRPKLILLDLVLPGMDGYEFLEKIKADKELASIPVIILSNLGQKSEVERAIKLGAEAFLVKANLDLDEISQKIKKSLEKIQ